MSLTNNNSPYEKTDLLLEKGFELNSVTNNYDGHGHKGTICSYIIMRLSFSGTTQPEREEWMAMIEYLVSKGADLSIHPKYAVIDLANFISKYLFGKGKDDVQDYGPALIEEYYSILYRLNDLGLPFGDIIDYMLGDARYDFTDDYPVEFFLSLLDRGATARGYSLLYILTDNHGMTREKRLLLAKALIEKGGANPNQYIDIYGTPLYRAKKYGDDELAEFLVSIGQPTITPPGRSQDPPRAVPYHTHRKISLNCGCL
jgi:hypothetical protein